MQVLDARDCSTNAFANAFTNAFANVFPCVSGPLERLESLGLLAEMVENVFGTIDGESLKPPKNSTSSDTPNKGRSTTESLFYASFYSSFEG